MACAHDHPAAIALGDVQEMRRHPRSHREEELVEQPLASFGQPLRQVEGEGLRHMGVVRGRGVDAGGGELQDHAVTEGVGVERVATEQSQALRRPAGVGAGTVHQDRRDPDHRSRRRVAQRHLAAVISSRVLAQESVDHQGDRDGVRVPYSGVEDLSGRDARSPGSVHEPLDRAGWKGAEAAVPPCVGDVGSEPVERGKCHVAKHRGDRCDLASHDPCDLGDRPAHGMATSLRRLHPRSVECR